MGTGKVQRVQLNNCARCVRRQRRGELKPRSSSIPQQGRAGNAMSNTTWSSVLPRCVSTPSCGCSASEGSSTRRGQTRVRRPRLLRVLRAQKVPELRNEQHNSQHNRSNAQPGAGQPLLCQVLLRAGVGACACQHRRDAAAPRAHRSASRLEGAAQPRAAARRVQASQPVDRGSSASEAHTPPARGREGRALTRAASWLLRSQRARTRPEGRDGLPGVPACRACMRARAVLPFPARSCVVCGCSASRVAQPASLTASDAPGPRAAQQQALTWSAWLLLRLRATGSTSS